MKKRVVVTGIGVVSPIGTGKENFWNALREGVVGIDTVTRFDASEYTTQIAGEVKDFDPTLYINKKEAKRMDRFAQFGVAAAKLALEDSKIDVEATDMERFGVIIGSGIGGIETLEKEHEKLLNKGPGRVSPFLIPMMIGNIASGQISIATGAKGPNTTVVTACASATNAIGDAFKAVQRGDADLMFTGGCEASVTPIGMAGFCTMKAMSTRNDDPKTASRPFDIDRDGFVMGEGSGIIVLEELEHAKARGAHIYGEVVGYGATGDAYHITSPAPDGEGAARSMKMAVEDGGLAVEDITYINVHGTSTPYNDKFETMAIKTVFGDHAKELLISSTKSMTGHMLGAAGGVEAIACLLALDEGHVHGTMSIQNQDPELDLNVLPNKGVDTEVNAVLSNSLGFGGHNATICMKKYVD